MMDGSTQEYHDRGFEGRRATVAFCDWLDMVGYLKPGTTILDLCCGQGGDMFYMSKRYPDNRFVGIEKNMERVIKGNDFFRDNGIKNSYLALGDIFELDYDGFDGIISLQTMSWLPDFKELLTKMASGRWMALSSLFYEGDISCDIQVTDSGVKSYYNVYSLKEVTKFIYELGFNNIKYKPFEIDIDLAKPVNRMGTYTEKLENGHRIQISGPLLMPWYFVGGER
jgi:ubiquinone/menaquinone biosynthesis C-methylase UbiE